MLKELIALDETHPEVSQVWRASEVGECETYLGHVRLGHEALPMPGRVKHLLHDGNVHERDVVTHLNAKGFRVLHSCITGQMSVQTDIGLRVFGHPDGILDMPCLLYTSPSPRDS